MNGNYSCEELSAEVMRGRLFCNTIHLSLNGIEISLEGKEKAWQIEEKGKPMVIAVSDETYELVKDKIKAEKGEGCYYLEKEEVL